MDRNADNLGEQPSSALCRSDSANAVSSAARLMLSMVRGSSAALPSRSANMRISAAIRRASKAGRSGPQMRARRRDILQRRVHQPLERDQLGDVGGRRTVHVHGAMVLGQRDQLARPFHPQPQLGRRGLVGVHFEKFAIAPAELASKVERMAPPIKLATERLHAASAVVVVRYRVRNVYHSTASQRARPPAPDSSRNAGQGNLVPGYQSGDTKSFPPP
jgi:hypothetical protein